MASLQNDSVSPPPPPEWFKCRMCTENFKVTLKEVENDVPMKLEQFCAVLNFSGEPVPDECFKNAIPFCYHCEFAVKRVVTDHEEVVKAQAHLLAAKGSFEYSRSLALSKVILPVSPHSEPDWFTTLMNCMIKEREKENSSVSFQSAENLAFVPSGEDVMPGFQIPMECDNSKGLNDEGDGNIPLNGINLGLNIQDHVNVEEPINTAVASSMQFKCRWCNVNFQPPVNKSRKKKGSRARAQMFRKFCYAFNFTGKSLPGKCSKDKVHICQPCEDDIENIVSFREIIIKANTMDFNKMKSTICKKVKVPTFPPALVPGFPPEPDWLTDLTELIVKKGNEVSAKKLGKGKNETGHCSRQDAGTSPIRFPQEENLALVFNDIDCGESNSPIDDESLSNQELQQNSGEDIVLAFQPNRMECRNDNLQAGGSIPRSDTNEDLQIQNAEERMNLGVATPMELGFVEHVENIPEVVEPVNEPGQNERDSGTPPPPAGYTVTPRRRILGAKVNKLSRDLIDPDTGTMKKEQLLSCGECKVDRVGDIFSLKVCKRVWRQKTTFEKMRDHIIKEHFQRKGVVVPSVDESVEPPHIGEVCEYPRRNPRRSKPVSRSLQTKMDAHKEEEKREDPYYQRKLRSRPKSSALGTHKKKVHGKRASRGNVSRRRMRKSVVEVEESMDVCHTTTIIDPEAEFTAQ
ncbi:unnamed protein product [Orchesella dallaii]|uniref:ZAD domain-containing protein n=1 Tax=Orchesella dallaii TaxID=48710 RepID=A0ABP1RIV2_9HEXA